MSTQEVKIKIKSILIQQFKLQRDQFSWKHPLEQLNEEFKILSCLILLEQLFNQLFGKKIPLLKKVSTAFHTPQDLVDIVLCELDNKTNKFLEMKQY